MKISLLDAAIKAAIAAAVCVPFAKLAQDFSSKPVRIIVPWPPSGNIDITVTIE